MSELCVARTQVESKVLLALEESIRQLANDFQHRSALNFYHEAELAAYLMMNLRINPATVENVKETSMQLSHLEWPCLIKRRIDLVLWRPGACEEAIKFWGKGRGNSAKRLPLLAAVQIKRGPGRLISWSSTEKDLKDLENLYAFENFGKPVLYFLEWVDHSLQRLHKNDRKDYLEIQLKLREWCGDKSNRRALVISRDNVGFAYPKKAWLLDPLPKEVKEDIG